MDNTQFYKQQWHLNKITMEQQWRLNKITMVGKYVAWQLVTFFHNS